MAEIQQQQGGHLKNRGTTSLCVFAAQIAIICFGTASRAQTSLSDSMGTVALEAGMAVPQDVSLFVPAAAAVKAKPAALSTPPTALLTSTANGSYFQQLQRLYAQATLPTSEDLTGWFAGRCFQYDDQENASGDMLAGTWKTLGGDNGPLFPSKPLFRIVHLWNAEPAHFDDIPEDRVADVLAAVNASFDGLTTAAETDGALASQNKEGGLEYRIRKYDSYFIESAVLLRNSGNGQKTGDIYAMCYYFKKVR